MVEPDQSDALLEVRELRTHFLTQRGRVRAVDGVSFSLNPGRTLGIVGESGSGKTILSRSIMGLLPRNNVVRSGSVVFDGRDLMQLEDQELRKLCGHQLAMVFQDPMSSLNPVMTVGRQITESLRLHLKLGRRQARDAAVELLGQVNIPEAGRWFVAYPHQLSGGMRQRVMIALALACGPRLLFADEPTTALDVTVQSEILNLLADLQQERSMAMVLVTHDLGVVAGRTDEIAVMYGGRIVEQAPTPTLFAAMRHPYTEALLRSIPQIAAPSHTRLLGIGGRPPDPVSPAVGCAFAERCPYVHRRCRHEEPKPTVEDGGHRYSCFAPLGSTANHEALEANLAAGLPQTLTAFGRSAGPTSLGPLTAVISDG